PDVHGVRRRGDRPPEAEAVARQLRLPRQERAGVEVERRETRPGLAVEGLELARDVQAARSGEKPVARDVRQAGPGAPGQRAPGGGVERGDPEPGDARRRGEEAAAERDPRAGGGDGEAEDRAGDPEVPRAAAAGRRVEREHAVAGGDE